ncbi:hypothetical protein PHLGIDRAFT_52461, partial [Phlebiopsis gigantea 11061_1 CR5-6]
MKGNAICHSLPTPKIYNVLPPPREDLDEVLAIIFIGPTPPTEADYKRTPLLIRKNKVLAALNWLRLNHADYKDIVISNENLATYSETVPVVLVDYHPSKYTKDPESTAVNDSEEFGGTASGECPFVCHVLTIEDTSKYLDNKNYKELKAAAAKHFSTGGRALAIGHDPEPESLYSNPQLYPKMYPWLFPYGLGGLGNNRMARPLSAQSRKRNLLQYHDK